MCSIVGGVIDRGFPKEHYDNLLEIVRTALTRKGYDGFSLTVIQKDKPTFRCKNRDVKDILNVFEEVTKSIKARTTTPTVFLLFGRATPETEAQAEDLSMIQPFAYRATSNNDVVTAHHGLDANYDELKANYDLELNTSIDSEVMPYFVDALFNEAKENGWGRAETQERFGQIVEGSHVLLFLKNNNLGWVNNYLGLWGVSFTGDFTHDGDNKNFVVYNTDLSKQFNTQFELPLYQAGWLGGIS